jgi:hypothetical protein
LELKEKPDVQLTKAAKAEELAQKMASLAEKFKDRQIGTDKAEIRPRLWRGVKPKSSKSPWSRLVELLGAG